MRIVVLGGYGVFGARLAELLVRDGHDVWVAGRSESKAQGMAAQLGCYALVIDRNRDLSALTGLGIGCLVDAAGPFQNYGDDPYRLVRICLEAGINYLDLADDGAFCAGISELDELARAQECFALSGVSSVPALSSAVVAELSQGMTRIEAIETAILPGNRAPRGRSVVQSILGQVGQDFEQQRDGVPVAVRAWSEPKHYEIGKGISRAGWVIEVPDQRLFPTFFKARSVVFRAGLELGVMNWGLAAFSWLRGKLGFGLRGWMVEAVRFGATLLAPFGSDRGGMAVDVVGDSSDRMKRRSWRLLAEAGEGPFIPAVAARVLLRRPEGIAPGARPALAEFTLVEFDAAVSDLAVSHTRDEAELVPAFEQVLGAEFARLPDAVQASHRVFGPVSLVGTSRITRGSGLWPRLLGGLFGFPSAGEDVAVRVEKTPVASGEIWERDFAGKRFVSHLKVTPDGMTERFGPLTFLLGLKADETGLSFPVLRGWAFGFLPLPRALLPQSEAFERESDGVFEFDVQLSAPLTGQMIVRYQGRLRREVSPN
jgi:hypothetical protein